MALPDFLVIGAPKAGTTALHAALAGHPALYMSPIKEPKFFLSDGPPPTRGGPGDALTYREHVWRRADYEALFRRPPAGRCGANQRRSTCMTARPCAASVTFSRRPGSSRSSGTRWSAPTRTGRTCGRPGSSRWGTSFRPREGAAPDRGRLGVVLALHRPGPVRGAARAHLSLFPREQVYVIRYRQFVDQPAATSTASSASSAWSRGSSPKCHGRTSPRIQRRRWRTARSARSCGRARPWAGSCRGHRRPRPRPGSSGSSTSQPGTAAARLAAAPGAHPAVRGGPAAPGPRPRRGLQDWRAPRDRSGGMVGARPEGQSQARNGRPVQLS